MIFTLTGPVFWATFDEDAFFSLIYRLPSFKSVTGRGLELDIEFTKELDSEIVEALLIIMHRWDIDLTPLLPYKQLCQSGLWEE